MTFFSRSEISLVRRSGPATTRSIASSSSGMVMAGLPRRAVSSAPSLITLARSDAVEPGDADADEHLDEVRAADREERDARLSGHRAGQERLSRTRRAVEEDSARDLGPDGLELRRILEVLLDLTELLDRLLDPGHVL